MARRTTTSRVCCYGGQMLSDGSSASAQAFSADAEGVAAEESTVDSEAAGWVPSAAPALGASSAMVVRCGEQGRVGAGARGRDLLRAVGGEEREVCAAGWRLGRLGLIWFA